MNMKRANPSVPALFVLCLAACAGSSRGERFGAGAEPTSCPLGIPGTSIGVVDIDGGVAVTLSSPHHADEVRIRLRDTAFVHGPGEHAGLGHAGRHGRGDGHGLRLYEAPPAKATVEDRVDGAELRLVALDPARADELRAKLHERARAIDASLCP
jgi:hypothetical protein